jgi:hypothetical protein
MTPKAERIRDRGVVQHRHSADRFLERPGDSVLVHRGVPRSLVMACPDGCGDTLTINLDPRTAKAWRFYRKRNQVSIYPSVWRDTGCLSHFIVWNHQILWCGNREEDSNIAPEEPEALRERILALSTREWQHYTELAERLDEVPWDVNRLCREMTHAPGILVEREGKSRGYFRLR